MKWADFIAIVSNPYYSEDLENDNMEDIKVSFASKLLAVTKLLSALVAVILFWPAMAKWVLEGSFTWMIYVIIALVTAAVSDILLERSSRKDAKRDAHLSRTK